MPDNLSAERRASMTAYGAELILTPASKGGMEYARDLAAEMQARGEGKVLDQFANGDNPRVHYETTGPEVWRDTGGPHHALRQRDGDDRHDHGRLALPEGTESRRADHRRAARRGFADSRASANGPLRTCRRSTTPGASTGWSTSRRPRPRRWRDAWRARKASSAASRRPARSSIALRVAAEYRGRDDRLHRVRPRRSLPVDRGLQPLSETPAAVTAAGSRSP